MWRAEQHSGDLGSKIGEIKEGQPAERGAKIGVGSKMSSVNVYLNKVSPLP